MSPVALSAVLLFSVAGNPDKQQIYQGIEAENCQFPTMAMLGFGGCTATLVSPWIVITAAHCVGDVDNPGNIFLGESFGAPTQVLPVDYCRRNPEYDPNFNNGVNGADLSYCKLVTPVYDVPFTPIVYGCEEEILTAGREAWIVGIGANAEDGSGFGLKRFLETTVLFAPGDLADGIVVGDVLEAACSGDSGGPAYVQYPDGSWHVFGVTSGGVPPCGAGADTYAVMSVWVPWVEEDSGFDITPCHDADGTWNPNGLCQGFETDPLDSSRQWGDLCLGDVSGPSDTCGPPFDAVPDADAPSVMLTNPGDGTVFDSETADVNLEMEADDGDGYGVRVVRISINGNVQETELREPPFELPATFPTGVFELQAEAEDWAGNIGMSDVVRIAVNAELPPEPEGTSTGMVDGSSSSGGEAGTGEGTDDGNAQDDDGGDSGCGCRSAGPGFGALLLLVGVGLRRRRRLGT